MANNQLDLFFSPSSEQQPKNFKIYRSSAGSGKTFALVKEYLKIVLRDPGEYKHILALTFTNKATEEMKGRIVNDLSALARDEKTEMRRELEGDFARENIQMEIHKRAAMALNNILYDYSRFNVSTIDHFFTQVVKLLARELKLPAKYDIDVDNEKAIEEAVEGLYLNLDQDPELLRWMEQFAFNRLDNDKGWKVDQNIKELGKELFKEKFHSGFADNKVTIKDLEKFVNQLSHTRREFQQTLKNYAHKAIDFIQSRSLTIKDFKNNTANYFPRTLDGNYDITETFKNVALGQDNWYTQSSLKKTKITEVAEQGLNQIAKELYEYHSSLYKDYISAEELQKNIYSYGLLDLLYAELTKYRTRNNLFLLSDTNFILRNVIGPNDTPFLFEKLGNNYRHILIDEFQDTSNYQWKNLLPLVINSVTNMDQGIVVGDIKQSIYRWRGGDFNLLLTGVEEDLKPFARQLSTQKLDDNWRSAKNIVHFNNAFFEVAQLLLQSNPELPSAQTLISDAYQDLKQNTKISREGYVEVQFFEVGNDDYGFSSKSNSAAQGQTLEVIKQAIKNDGYQFGDIMILVDKWDLAGEMSHTLTQADIPIVTENSLFVDNSPLVRLILNTMGWLEDSTDRMARSNMLYLFTQLKGLAVADFHELFTSEGEDSLLHILPKSFIENIDHIRTKPVFELVEELMICFSLQDKVDIYLQRFQDICLDQSVRGKQNLPGFLEWWRDSRNRREKRKELSVILPPNTNAVEIKTIHQAKGQEAPIIIIPFANFDLRPMSKSTFWTNLLVPQYEQFKLLPLNFSKNLPDSHFEDAYRQELLEESLERLNIAYVAFTRPKDRLYIFANKLNTKTYKGEVNSLNKLIYGVMDHYNFHFKEQWDSGSWKLQIGKLEKKDTSIEEKSGSTDHPFTTYPSHPYLDKITIRPDSKRLFLLFDNERSRKIKDGLKMHLVLEKLTDANSLNRVLDQLLGEGLLDIQDQTSLRETINQYFENSTFADWFSSDWQVFGERTIVSGGNEYRPDRVITKDNRAVVIDYKREKVEKKHEHQINHYASLLANMGYDPIAKYLVYLTEFSIKEVN
ncbi:MAG: UvrD-helicase domain-containing protein [Bacteroidetes bacterium]|nr:UvrD-helicase domain-containing protein [Bacteroidota bacterium]